MDTTRLALIIAMGVATYAIRVLPSLFFAGRNFSPRFDQYLRYLAYALMASVISTSLFFTGAQFEATAAPLRLLALLCAVLVAFWSRHALWGLFAGVLLTLIFS